MFTAKTLKLGTKINMMGTEVVVSKVSAKTFEVIDPRAPEFPARYHYTLLARMIESGEWAIVEAGN